MGFDSFWHWIIVVGIVLLLFGRGRVSELMVDVAQGIKTFKKNMADDEPATKEPPKTASIPNERGPATPNLVQPPGSREEG